jgi:murein DD-endopeptidase MepM/ murein hydrolase activator NlpD
MAPAPSRIRLLGPIQISFEQSGRRVRLDGRILVPAAAAAVLLVAWLIGSTAYFVFRDDLLGRLVARQTEMQFAYEDRIAGLRAQIDRITSRQLVDQDGMEGRLNELLSRQAQLETRNAMVLALAEGTTGGVSSTARVAQSKPASGAADTAPALAGKAPMPGFSKGTLPGTVSAFAPADAKPRVEQDIIPLRGASGAAEPVPLSTKSDAMRSSALQPIPQGGSVGGTLGVLAARLGFIEAAQLAALKQMEDRTRTHLRSLTSIVADLGLEPERLQPIGRPSAQGGPFVPLKVSPQSGPFEALVDSLQQALVEQQRMQQVVTVLPLRKPLPGDPEMTSGFGVRMDPFNRTAAMHTGIDFRDDYGSPVKSTAPGRVTVAEWTGGYGNMVEVDHGNGIATRYAHLSAITVEAGQMVATGAVVGRLGSTGRSTGPHLHYETRIDGEPVDPVRYIKAASRLQKLQQALSGG